MFETIYQLLIEFLYEWCSYSMSLIAQDLRSVLVGFYGWNLMFRVLASCSKCLVCESHLLEEIRSIYEISINGRVNYRLPMLNFSVPR